MLLNKMIESWKAGPEAELMCIARKYPMTHGITNVICNLHDKNKVPCSIEQLTTASFLLPLAISDDYQTKTMHTRTLSRIRSSSGAIPLSDTCL